jgi:hypothetical protein
MKVRAKVVNEVLEYKSGMMSVSLVKKVKLLDLIQIERILTHQEIYKVLTKMIAKM